jgi:hypothetical protein
MHKASSRGWGERGLPCCWAYRRDGIIGMSELLDATRREYEKEGQSWRPADGGCSPARDAPALEVPSGPWVGDLSLDETG